MGFLINYIYLHIHSKFIYNHPEKNIAGSNNNKRLPIDKNYSTNYIAKWVSYDNFNLSFDVNISKTPATGTFSFFNIYKFIKKHNFINI